MASKKHLCLVQETTGGRKGRKVGGNKMEVKCQEGDNLDDIYSSVKSKTVESEDSSASPSASASGGADIKSKYKKALNKKTLEDLRKMAKGKGIKITTKKDGKSAYLKKSSIINKLCDMKHPKKATKRK